MEQVIHIYDHAPDNAWERTVQFLYDSARTVLQRQAELQQRNDFLGVPTKKVIVAAAPKAGAANGKRKRPGDKKPTQAPFTNAQTVCATFCNDGVCRYGNKCKFAHIDPATLPKSLSGANGSPDKAEKVEPHMNLCRFLASGQNCTFGTKCWFRHYSNPPSKGDETAIAKGESAAMPKWVADKIKLAKGTPPAAPAASVPSGVAPRDGLPSRDPTGPVATSAYNKVVMATAPALICQAGQGESEEQPSTSRMKG